MFIISLARPWEVCINIYKQGQKEVSYYYWVSMVFANWLRISLKLSTFLHGLTRDQWAQEQCHGLRLRVNLVGLRWWNISSCSGVVKVWNSLLWRAKVDQSLTSFETKFDSSPDMSEFRRGYEDGVGWWSHCWWWEVTVGFLWGSKQPFLYRFRL